MLEKALEIARWVTSTGTEWDATTYSELMSTVEIAQIWDNKVVTTPFHQMQSRFARGSGGDHGDAGLWEEDVASSTTEELPLPQPSVAHSATAWLVGASRPMTAVGGAHGSEYGSMAMAGHSGFASALSAGLASVSRAGAAGREPGASPGGAAAGRKAVPTSQMLPLAIFPDQLRPAPYDGLRMLFLDQLNVSHFSSGGREGRCTCAPGLKAQLLTSRLRCPPDPLHSLRAGPQRGGAAVGRQAQGHQLGSPYPHAGRHGP